MVVHVITAYNGSKVKVRQRSKTLEVKFASNWNLLLILITDIILSIAAYIGVEIISECTGK